MSTQSKACEASKKIQKILEAIQQSGNHPSPITTEMDSSVMFLKVESNALNSWLFLSGSGLTSLAELVEALETAGWQKYGTDYAGRKIWQKPDNWKDPC